MKIVKYIGLAIIGVIVLFFIAVFIWGYLPLYNIHVDELDSEIRKADKIVVKTYVYDNHTCTEKIRYYYSH